MKQHLQIIIALLCCLFSGAGFSQTGWTNQTNPLGQSETAILGKVQFVSSTEGWISGGRGDFLHTTDAGVNWMVVTPFPNDTVWCSSDPSVSMSWVNSTHGWKINSFGPDYGISYGVVLHQTTDGGNTWQKKVLSTTEGDFGFQIQFADINIGWLLYFNFTTQAATFLKTTDGGINWVPFNGAGIFYFVDANNGWSYYGSGLNGSEPPYKILRTTNGGTDWTEQYTDNLSGGYNAIYFSDVNNGWIVGDAGKVLKTTDGGAIWNIVTNSGINPNDRSKTVFFLDANNGWISTKDGNGFGIIQHTTDGGTSWTTQGTPLVNPQGGNAIFSIFFVDAQNGWLTGDYGRICRYTGTTDIDDDINFVNEFTLQQNYPNPFNPSTKIRFTVGDAYYASPTHVLLRVYDVLGKEVATLVNEYKPAGRYEVEFDASDITSGVYFYRLTSGLFSETKKLILTK
jgi:photosystem II stability/assembly factor-like uncharacterized protein